MTRGVKKRRKKFDMKTDKLVEYEKRVRRHLNIKENNAQHLAFFRVWFGFKTNKTTWVHFFAKTYFLMITYVFCCITFSTTLIFINLIFTCKQETPLIHTFRKLRKNSIKWIFVPTMCEWKMANLGGFYTTWFLRGTSVRESAFTLHLYVSLHLFLKARSAYKILVYFAAAINSELR